MRFFILSKVAMAANFVDMPRDMHCPVLVDGSFNSFGGNFFIRNSVPTKFLARSPRITAAHGEGNRVTNIAAWPWLVHMDGIDVYDEYGATNQGCMGVIITKARG